MGHFAFALERVKGFVNVHLHCIVSNLKRISKISTLPACKNFCGHAGGCHVVPALTLRNGKLKRKSVF